MKLVFLLLNGKRQILFPFKKRGQTKLENDRAVSLISICGKILERLMFNDIFNFFIEDIIILSKQAGLKQGDSCINQLISITHEIYESFDLGLKVRSVFLDI